MSFPWEPAIPQAMQQHGGRSRLVANRSAEVAVVCEAAAAPSVGVVSEIESPAEARQPAAGDPV